MAIVSRIGRRSWRVRALFAGMYLALILGSVAMVYPFLIMVSGSTKSAVDAGDYYVVPGFLNDDLVLYRKHIEALFNESVVAARETYDMDIMRFDALEFPKSINEAFIREWRDFITIEDIPAYGFSRGHTDARLSKTIPQGQREFKAAVVAKYGEDIGEVNRRLGTQFASWNWYFDSTAGDTTPALAADCLSRLTRPLDTPFAREFSEFKQASGIGERYYLCVDGFFKSRFLKNRYTKSIENYNKEHGTGYGSYDEVHLAKRLSEVQGGEKEEEDWEVFVRELLNLLWVRVDKEATEFYRQFLEAKHGGIDALNRNYGTGYKGFEELPLIEEPPLGGMVLSDWEAFLTGWKDPDTDQTFKVPAEMLSVHSVDFMFREHLQKKFETVSALNTAAATEYKKFVDILPPQREMHLLSFVGKRRASRMEFLTRNYRTALDYIVFHGRGVANTGIYCGLAVLFALLVNPMAAYAMSRYRMPSTYKMLLFMMLTMAFPPMVTQIPVFLMLRELGLLNTFAALVLPGMANGYAIFLLKGFFDSLPRELYESAEIDGASEWRMFWQITMSLSKPILSVVALQAFTVAYSNFMFALLICQDRRMWTLMPWLYQLQQRSGPGVVYASLIIAAIPTFLIFVLCQKVIMRGIVVPVEK
jgi:multiple sugar transport system permease protein